MKKSVFLSLLLFSSVPAIAKDGQYHDNVQYRCYDGSMILNCRVISGPMRGIGVSCGWPTDEGGVMFTFARGSGWDSMKTCWPYEPARM